MAEENHAAEAAAGAAGKKGLLKLILVAVGASVLTAGGMFGAFMVLGEHPPQAASPDEHADEADGGDGQNTEKKKKKKKKKHDGPELPPTYMKLDNLTVNLAGGKDHFLAANLELKIAEPDAQRLLTERLPEVKNLVLLTLSSQTPDALATVEGKTALAQKLRDDLNTLIDQDEETGVADIFFTQFIIQ
ncbi:MAG: hypothetical protein FGM40_04535 [Rhodocyclaceae bacterium]|nr:hypothetical protein [Rhodocyclaceae bacterium]